MNETLQLLRAADHVRMPWKNGGGITTEIAAYPAGAMLDNFDWRVSMADVAQDGPFSMFPGVDRTLAVVTGAGLRLVIDGQAPQSVTPGSAPLSFPADVPVQCHLIEGRIVDLNVMSRRGTWQHRLDPISVHGAMQLPHGAPQWLVVCHRGCANIEAAGMALSLSPGDAAVGTGAAASLTAVEPSLLSYIGLWPVQGALRAT